MRRWSLLLALLGACAQPEAPVDPPPPETGTPPPGTSPPNVALEEPPEPRFFVAHASLEVLHRLPAAFGAPPPMRLSPRRGAGYGRGEGRVVYFGKTPSEHIAVVEFLPVDSTRSASLFAVSTRGVSPDAPTPIAHGIRGLREVELDDTQAVFVTDEGLFAVALDGSEADAPRTLYSTKDDTSWIDGVAIGGPYVAFELVAQPGAEPRIRVASIDPTARPPASIDARYEAGYLRGATPDGRFFLNVDDGFCVFSPEHGPAVQALTWGEVDLLGVLEDGPIAVVMRQAREVGVVDFRQPVPEYRVLIQASNLQAHAVSGDGSQIYALSYFGAGVDVLHAPTRSARPAQVIAELPYNARNSEIAVSSDGRFLVACDRDRLLRAGPALPLTVISETACAGAAPRSIVGGDRIVMMSGAERMRLVSLDDGRIEDIDGVPSSHVRLEDGLLSYSNVEPESTIYRMDQPERVQQLVPWRSPAIDEIHTIDGDLLYARGGRWYRLEGDGGPEVLVADWPGSQRFGITNGHLVLENALNVRSYPLDGTRPNDPVVEFRRPFPTIENGVADGHAFFVAGRSVYSARVDEPGTYEEVYFSSVDLQHAVYDPESKRLVLVGVQGQAIDVVALRVSGEEEIRLVEGERRRILGWPTRVRVAEGAARVVLTLTPVNDRGGPTPPAIWAVDISEPSRITEVTDDGQSLWAGPQAPFLSNGTRAVIVDTTATFVASLTAHTYSSIIARPLGQIGPATISRDDRWLLGHTSDGLFAVRTDGAGQVISVAADAFAARFTPNNQIVYAAHAPDGGDSALYVRTVREDDEPRRVTPSGFRVAALLDADQDGSLVTSLSGGDWSVFWVGHDQRRPIAVTPLDDARETLIEPLVAY